MMYFLLVAETLIWVFMIYTRIVIFLDETWNGLNIIFLMAYKVEKGFDNFNWTFRKKSGTYALFYKKNNWCPQVSPIQKKHWGDDAYLRYANGMFSVKVHRHQTK